MIALPGGTGAVGRMKGLAGGAGQVWEGDALRIDRSDASLFAAGGEPAESRLS